VNKNERRKTGETYERGRQVNGKGERHNGQRDTIRPSACPKRCRGRNVARVERSYHVLNQASRPLLVRGSLTICTIIAHQSKAGCKTNVHQECRHYGRIRMDILQPAMLKTPHTPHSECVDRKNPKQFCDQTDVPMRMCK
jgi:hypothetical protein